MHAPFQIRPASVALIGASAEPTKLGHIIFRNLINGGFKGALWPVNPKGGKILDHDVVPSIEALPNDVDLAIIVTPAATVAELLRACGKRGMKNVIVISAGFGETGTDEGKEREAELISLANEEGIALIGPNCLGMLCPTIGLNASFANMPKQQQGTIGLISQSGAMAVALLDRGDALHLGFSSVISIGNKSVLTEIDLLRTLIEDPQTRVICLYLESLSNARTLATIARATSKPIVLVKAGVSIRGSTAVSSHTGALAGSTAALEAMAIAGGIHLARSTEEFFNLLAVLSTNPPLPTRNIAIITNAEIGRAHV